jgi:hypothetical protein
MLNYLIAVFVRFGDRKIHARALLSGCSVKSVESGVVS